MIKIQNLNDFIVSSNVPNIFGLFIVNFHADANDQ